MGLPFPRVHKRASPRVSVILETVRTGETVQKRDNKTSVFFSFSDSVPTVQLCNVETSQKNLEEPKQRDPHPPNCVGGVIMIDYDSLFLGEIEQDTFATFVLAIDIFFSIVIRGK